MAYVLIRRPKIITWGCIIGFIIVILSLPQVFSPDTRRLGDFYPALFALIISLRFISLVGVWHMKRWGAELFLIVLVFQIILSLLIESYTLNSVGVFFNVSILIDFIAHYKKMDRNL